MSPDPNAHGPLTNPSVVIQSLLASASYAADRVIQGDWSERYANKKLMAEARAAEAGLRALGAESPDTIAVISAGARAFVRWEYLWNGETRQGAQYAKGLTV
jgi:hypothetical protein